MRYSSKFAAAALLLPLLATPAFAQAAQQGLAQDGDKIASAAPQPDSGRTKGTPDAKSATFAPPPIVLQHFRPNDQRGLNVFETPKDDGVAYEGFKLGWGAAFTQQFQGLQHSNTSAPVMVNGVNANRLITIGNGFNNAVANLYLGAQVAKGIRVSMTSYLSARHHQESWVKDGYALIDASPIDNALLNRIMQYTTLKVGHFQLDYGDQQARRSDNGNAMYNPFVGNLILDAFTTEIGGEVFLRNNGWLAMGGVTGGEVHGQVTAPVKRSESFLGKLGFDKQPTKDLRVRLTGSFYANGQSASNTLFTGDRAGSRYYDVMENTTSTETSNAWSGNVRPGFSNNVHAYVLNPFIKYQGLEYFGNFETATGKGAAELKNRNIRQLDNELVYRFAKDQLYVGGRYNTVNGELAGIANDINVKRTAFSAGWFVNPLMLAKIEYVRQNYNNYPTNNILNGGQFKGFMVEAVLGF